MFTTYNYSPNFDLKKRKKTNIKFLILNGSLNANVGEIPKKEYRFNLWAIFRRIRLIECEVSGGNNLVSFNTKSIKLLSFVSLQNEYLP